MSKEELESFLAASSPAEVPPYSHDHISEAVIYYHHYMQGLVQLSIVPLSPPVPPPTVAGLLALPRPTDPARTAGHCSYGLDIMAVTISFITYITKLN